MSGGGEGWFGEDLGSLTSHSMLFSIGHTVCGYTFAKRQREIISPGSWDFIYQK